MERRDHELIENVDFDHVRPRVHGSQDQVGSSLASCKKCNSLRGRLHYSELKEALAFGKWAMQHISKQTTIGIALAKLYGKHWVAKHSIVKKTPGGAGG